VEILVAKDGYTASGKPLMATIQREIKTINLVTK
jgi:hypothetical protein